MFNGSDRIDQGLNSHANMLGQIRPTFDQMAKLGVFLNQICQADVIIARAEICKCFVFQVVRIIEPRFCKPAVVGSSPQSVFNIRRQWTTPCSTRRANPRLGHMTRWAVGVAARIDAEHKLSYAIIRTCEISTSYVNSPHSD